MDADTAVPLTEQADLMDNYGHRWSGQPALDFFAAATALRNVDAVLNGRTPTDPVTAEALAGLARQFDLNGHLWSGKAANDFWAAYEALDHALEVLSQHVATTPEVAP